MPHSVRTITFHASALASRIAQDKQLRRRLLTRAFQPFSEHRARTNISMSDPNCVFRDS